MYCNKHFTAIVLAAGSGSRMKSDIPKQYMKLGGKEVLYYSLKAFQDSIVDDIILVTRKDDIDFCRHDIIDKYHFDKVKAVVEGGSERYWSVKRGLEISEGSDYVLIHDGARPCVNNDIIHRIMEEVLKCNACTAGVPVKDTIKLTDDNDFGIETPRRDRLWQVQTPQAFLYEEISRAYDELGKDDGNGVTDDTMIVERYIGRRSKMVFGEYTNIKITTPEDILIAEIFLEKS